MYSLSILYKTWANAWSCCAVAVRGADELDKQLIVGENHVCSLLHETLLQNKPMIVVCSFFSECREKKEKNN